MAKEYFSLKNQVIEFDTDARTMIVVISDDKFKTISVNSMTENVFNSQYLSMKAEVAKALVSNLNVSSSYAPNDSDANTFNEFKQQALDYFQNNL
jgi:hypothetical protein